MSPLKVKCGTVKTLVMSKKSTSPSPSWSVKASDVSPSVRVSAAPAAPRPI
jgi:hypothetical protein